MQGRTSLDGSVNSALSFASIPTSSATAVQATTSSSGNMSVFWIGAIGVLVLLVGGFFTLKVTGDASV